jgi:hypothetical protein
MMGAMATAKHFATLFHSMPDDASVAMGTAGREDVDRALKAIEDMIFTLIEDVKSLIVLIATVFAHVLCRRLSRHHHSFRAPTHHPHRGQVGSFQLHEKCL